MNFKVQKVLGVLFFAVVFCLFSTSVATEERGTEELEKLKALKAAYPRTTASYRGVVAIDANSGCADELYCDFGGNGLWRYESSSWTKMNAGDPDFIMGFILGGTERLLVDFGSAGIWYWYYNSGWTGTWVKISSASPDWAFAVDDDGDGDDEIMLDYGTNGLWRCDLTSGLSLVKLHAYNVDNNGLESELWGSWPEASFDFGTSGHWITWNNSPGQSWQKLSSSSFEDDNCAADFVSTDGGTEIIIDFGTSGIWLHNGTAWNQISSTEAFDMVPVYFGGGADYELLCTFDTSVTNGLWWWNYTGYPGSWTLLTGTNPDWDGGFCEPFDPDNDGWEEVAVDFAANGLWLYDHDGTSWTKINASDPEFMVRSNYGCDTYDTVLVVDFGATGGLWIYDGQEATTKWTKLTTFSPDGVN